MLARTPAGEYPLFLLGTWGVLSCVYLIAYLGLPEWQRIRKGTETRERLLPILKDVCYLVTRPVVVETLFLTLLDFYFHDTVWHCVRTPYLPAMPFVDAKEDCQRTLFVLVRCFVCVLVCEALSLATKLLAAPLLMGHLSLDSKTRLPVQMFKRLGLLRTALLVWLPRYAAVWMVGGINAKHAFFTLSFTHITAGLALTHANYISGSVLVAPSRTASKPAETIKLVE
jgi:hypothetical protein